MNPFRAQDFRDEYVTQLDDAVRNYPREYCYSPDQVPGVVERMMHAIEHHTFSKDSRAIRATCRALGIRHTYKAIYEWLEVE